MAPFVATPVHANHQMMTPNAVSGAQGSCIFTPVHRNKSGSAGKCHVAKTFLTRSRGSPKTLDNWGTDDLYS